MVGGRSTSRPGGIRSRAGTAKSAERSEGTVSDAKKARAELLTEVERGRHRGTAATVDELFLQWLIELERKGRSAKTINNYRQTYRHNIAPTLGPTAVTKVTTKMLTDLYGGASTSGALGAFGLPDSRHDLVHDDAGMSVGMARLEPGPMGRPADGHQLGSGRPDGRRGTAADQGRRELKTPGVRTAHTPGSYYRPSPRRTVRPSPRP